MGLEVRPMHVYRTSPKSLDLAKKVNPAATTLPFVWMAPACAWSTFPTPKSVVTFPSPLKVVRGTSGGRSHVNSTSCPVIRSVC